MKHVFNSILGSFGRVIGRILAYILIGLIVTYLASFWGR